MGRARNLADVIGGRYDIPSTALDNAQAALEAGDITADLIADGAVTNAKIASGVDAGKLTTGTIPAARIADGSIAAGKLDTVYQTPLTAGTDYLAPNGDGSGLSGIASDRLSKSMPLASGTSVSTNDFVSVNDSGEVGEYPVTNTVNDDLADAGLSRYITYSDSSNTRFLQLYTEDKNTGNEGQYLIQVYGVGYDTTTGTFSEGSAYTVHDWDTNNAYGGNGGSTQSYTVTPLSGTGKFLITGYVSEYGWNISNTTKSGGRCFGKLITVNANGSITQHQSFDVTRGLTNTSYGRRQRKYNYSRYHHMVGAGDQNTEYVRSVHVNSNETSWTVTDEGSNSGDGGNWGGVYFADLGNNSTAYCVDFVNNTDCRVRGLSMASTNISGSASEISNGDIVLENYNNYLQYYSNNMVSGEMRRTFISYKDGTGSHRLAVIDVADDGTPSLKSNNVVPASQEALTGSNTYLIFQVISSTKLICYNNGKLNTVEFNTDGTLKGYGITAWNNSNVNRYRYTADGKLHLWISGSTNKQTIDINAFSTSEYSFAGVASSNASSGDADIVVGGIVDGFTGLTAGVNYSINAASYDGSIVPSTDTNAGKLVGKAISSTEILLAGVQS
jgi:hypothetical protein